MKQARQSLSLLAVLAAAGLAPGQEAAPGVETLDPTVVTAEGEQGLVAEEVINPELSLGGKLPFSSFETPRAVETVTRAQFTERGAGNLEEATRYLSGVESGYYGLDTRQDFVRVRGLNTLSYRDGLQYNYNFYNNTPQETYAIEQIDIVKGPATMLFGRGVVGGAVNVTSKVARPGAENELMLGYGSENHYEAGFDYNQAIDAEETFFFRMVGYFRQSDTYVDFVNDDAWFLMPSLTWKPSEDTTLSLLVNIQENESKPSLQFYPYEATQVPGFKLKNNRYGGEPSLDRYDTEQQSVSLIFEHEFNETYSLNSTLRYTSSSAEYWEHTIVPPIIGNNVIQQLPAGVYHRLLYGAEHETDVFSGNVVLNAEYEFECVTHHVQFGFDFAQADRERDTIAPNPNLFGLNYGYGGYLDFTNPTYGVQAMPRPALGDRDSFEEEVYGFYLSDRIEWGNFIVSLGARYDDYSLESRKFAADEQSEWTFDAGLMYQFANGVSPYYSFAQSFEPQGINDLTGQPLDPKSGEQHEIGVKWMVDEKTMLVASYFQVDEENRVLRPDPFTVVQSSSVEVDGAELSIHRREGDFYLQAGYTYLETANNDFAGSPALSGVPEHQAHAWLGYDPQGGPLADFRAGIGVRYTGSSSDGRDFLNTKPHTLVDAMIGYRWGDMDIRLNVTNLFDEQYIQTIETSETLGYDVSSAFLGQDRAVNLSATYHF